MLLRNTRVNKKFVKTYSAVNDRASSLRRNDAPAEGRRGRVLLRLWRHQEVGRALGRTLGIHYTSVSVMFGAGFLMLWLLLAGYSIRDLTTRAILTLTGHLRTRPDPWLECALRKALTEFDRELAAILHDSGNPGCPRGGPQPARSGSPEPGSADKALTPGRSSRPDRPRRLEAAPAPGRRGPCGHP